MVAKSCGLAWASTGPATSSGDEELWGLRETSDGAASAAVWANARHAPRITARVFSTAKLARKEIAPSCMPRTWLRALLRVRWTPLSEATRPARHNLKSNLQG